MTVQTNRSLAKYIIFTIITCGIYSLYTIYAIARDINMMCEDDGYKTAGLLKYFLLSLITCSIYSLYWHYKVADRLHGNAEKYNITITESGSTVLVWLLLGCFICPFFQFFAMYIIFKNMNLMAVEYNNKLDSNAQF